MLQKESEKTGSQNITLGMKSAQEFYLSVDNYISKLVVKFDYGWPLSDCLAYLGEGGGGGNTDDL